MSHFEEAPPLPREPTLLRVNKPSSKPPLPRASSQAPSPSPQLDTAMPSMTHPALSTNDTPVKAIPTKDIPTKDTPTKDIPLPPRFPSINDVTTAWSAPAAADPADVVWNRPITPAPTSKDDAGGQTAEEDTPSKPRSFLARLKAMLPMQRTSTPVATGEPSTASEQNQPDAKPSAAERAVQTVRRLPDPSLLFLFEVIVILILRSFAGHVLRSWPARLLVPLVLLATVAAAAVWRPTVLFPVDASPLVSRWKAIPDAKCIVARGEKIRARETALLQRREKYDRDQARLLSLRKEIQIRLPPPVSIASLLMNEE